MEEYKKTFQRVRELGKRAGEPAIDELVRAHVAQHLCIMVSSAIEIACSSILTGYAARTAGPATARYARTRLAQFNNANPEKIHQLVLAFDPAWAAEVDTFWTGRIRDAIGSVVANRHNISHGRPINVSLAQVLTWARDAENFCDKLEQIAGPKQ